VPTPVPQPLYADGFSDDDGTSSTSTGSSGRIIAPSWRPVTASARRLTSARGPVTEGLEGELLKQSLGPFNHVSWKRRWFLIKDGMLLYKKTRVRSGGRLLGPRRRWRSKR